MTTPAGDVSLETLVQYYLSLRADGLSIVTTAERALVELGYQVETAVRPRQERRCKTALPGRSVDATSSID